MSEHSNKDDTAKPETTEEAPSAGGGEDEGSSSVDGKDDHLHDDQKPTTK